MIAPGRHNMAPFGEVHILVIDRHDAALQCNAELPGLAHEHALGDQQRRELITGPSQRGPGGGPLRDGRCEKTHLGQLPLVFSLNRERPLKL